MSEYREVLKNWFKGTGGGSGEYNMFENWSDEKLNKYNINPELYDHTNIQVCPPIMIKGYAKNKKYLTILFMLDNRKDLLLASKYDPVKIGMGEAGIRRQHDDDSRLSSITPNLSNTSSPKAKKANPEEEACSMMKTILQYAMDTQAEDNPKKNEVPSAETLALEN